MFGLLLFWLHLCGKYWYTLHSETTGGQAVNLSNLWWIKAQRISNLKRILKFIPPDRPQCFVPLGGWVTGHRMHVLARSFAVLHTRLMKWRHRVECPCPATLLSPSDGSKCQPVTWHFLQKTQNLNFVDQNTTSLQHAIWGAVHVDAVKYWICGSKTRPKCPIVAKDSFFCRF